MSEKRKWKKIRVQNGGIGVGGLILCECPDCGALVWNPLWDLYNFCPNCGNPRK